MDALNLNPTPVFSRFIGVGIGIAHCTTLGVFVVSTMTDNALHVFKLPELGKSADLELLYTLGNESFPSVSFKFHCGFEESGQMAFTGPPTSRRLLVTDAGNAKVHVIDVVGRVHVGYVGQDRVIEAPRGIAAWGNLVAFSAQSRLLEDRRNMFTEELHKIYLYEGSEATWTLIRLVGNYNDTAVHQLVSPSRLRFTTDGMGLVVVEPSRHRSAEFRLSVFRVQDGSFVNYLATDMHGCATDVEECEGGWLVSYLTYNSGKIEFVGNDGTRRVLVGIEWGDDRTYCPEAMAMVPGLGLMVMEAYGCGEVRVFSSYETIAMAGMSAHRVGWMVAVARGIATRGRVVPFHETDMGTDIHSNPHPHPRPHTHN